MNDDLIKFKPLYFETAKEYAETLRDNLAHLASSGEKEAVEKIFIAAHSLKSQSLMMGYQKVGHASQLIEKAFRNIKDGIIQKEQINSNLIANTIDKISKWLDAVDAAGLEPDLDEEIAQLEKMLA